MSAFLNFAVNSTGRNAMKTHYTVVLAMAAGFGLGAVAVQGLHAQAKPPVYFVAEIDVTNPDAYAKEYAPKAQAIIKAAGGRFLAIGGSAATSGRGNAFEGGAPKRVGVQGGGSMGENRGLGGNTEYVGDRQ